MIKDIVHQSLSYSFLQNNKLQTFQIMSYLLFSFPGFSRVELQVVILVWIVVLQALKIVVSIWNVLQLRTLPHLWHQICERIVHLRISQVIFGFTSHSEENFYMLMAPLVVQSPNRIPSFERLTHGLL